MSNAYTNMGKLELRAQCKLKGIKNYGKMTVADMRAALTTYDESIAASAAENPETIDLDTLDINGLAGKCPHCGIDHLENGYNTHDDVAADHGIKYAMDNHAREYSCLACNGEWGKVAEYDDEALEPVTEVSQPVKHIGTGIKIQKNREERNGIKRPSDGGACAAVWIECDRFYGETGKTPMPKDMKQWALANGRNANNAVIELYQWRKWAGISK